MTCLYPVCLYTPNLVLSWVLCSIEFVSSSGKLLKQLSLSDCGQAARAAGGVNETRGVSRPRLLSVLAEQLPRGAIKFNSSVVGMSDLNGSGGLSTGDAG